MGTLRFGTLTCSLDGYFADAGGGIDWTSPSVEAHRFVNALVRETSTFVLGRRMWETLRVWDTMPGGGESVEGEFADIWRVADKVVCSDTLTSDTLSSAGSRRTRLEGRLTNERLAQIVAATSGVVELGGPTVAADALQAGLVDEVLLLVAPQLLGGGRRVFPDGLRHPLTLVDERRFPDGVVYLRYGRA
jgi:dihydrofolate reductase